MLPAAPKSLGRLSDVLASCLMAASKRENPLNLQSVATSAVILVDGLGSANIRAAGGHAPLLNQLLKRDGSIYTHFPSTTASCLTSLCTGVSPGEHGLVGYRIYDRDTDRSRNLLTDWSSEFRPEHYVLVEQLSVRNSHQPLIFIGPPEYQGSGFTSVLMPNAKYEPQRSIDDRFDFLEKLISSGSKATAYLYVPELDQMAHSKGSQSAAWLTLLEQIESRVKKLGQLAGNWGALLTADHGIVNVSAVNHIFLDEAEQLTGKLLSVGGDPRSSFLFLKPEVAITQAFMASLQDYFGEKAIAVTSAELVEKGWFGAVNDVSRSRLPEVVILATTSVALYHRDFAAKKSMNMIGQHGSITDDEMRVPLLRLGKFGSQ